jgi:hypothetical protein
MPGVSSGWRRLNSIEGGMNKYVVVFWLILWGDVLTGQDISDTLGGMVSYTTSQNVYVKFSSTKSIAAGDTLYTISDGLLVPAVLVKYISATSCVGSPLEGKQFEKGERIYFRQPKNQEQPAQDIVPAPVVIVPDEKEIEDNAGPAAEVLTPKTVVSEKPSLKGRLSAAAYINFSDRPQGDQQRMRYVFSMNSRNIGHSRISAEAYLSFRHTINEWEDVRDDFLRAFKVYSFALEYDAGKQLRFWAGRKINFNISNIGAIDGIQAEKKWRSFLVGAFGGSRPDITDYGFNPNLLQYGGYIGHTAEGKNGALQSTLAMVEQQNNGMTDRRFLYFQHVNSIVKRVNLFTSFEFDLYQLVNGIPENTFHITSLYISLRYRVSDKLSVFGSYDARNNIIYYETYKNFIDQLLEEEMRQGLRFSFNYRPWKRVAIGMNTGYRYQRNTPGDSKNMNGYVTVSQVPGLLVSATASVTLIHSPYLDGLVYGLRMSRDIIKGKLYGELQYRIADYAYQHTEAHINQSIAGCNLSWRLTKKLSFAVNYEGEIQTGHLNNRMYTNLIQRF